MTPTSLTRSPLRVIVADHDAARRAWLKDALRADPRLTVIAAVGDGGEAAGLARHYRPDIRLCARGPAADDIKDRVGFGCERLQTRVLLLSEAGDEAWAVEALCAGASGAIDLALSDAALATTVVAAGSGESILPAGIASQLIERLREAPVPGQGLRPIRSPLSNREWEVIDLLIGGASTREVAETLVVAEDTVHSHIKHIMRKLGVRTRAEAFEAVSRLYAAPALAA
jgi:DNA-binding NarL/FixJ family response regulator